MWINVPEQKRVIARYGADAQAMIHAEELAELIQSVSKMRRAVNTGSETDAARYNLIEEIADTLICIKQMQEIYGVSDHDIQVMVDRKCRRQEARL
jgi:predicted house-cleaning noncanonical NTP pyrophosphatase (MazG superfamily)